MYVYVKKLDGPANFESAGFFINNKKWIHKKRLLKSFEFISVTEGTLYINVQGKDYTISKNQFLLIPPHHEHFGTTEIKQEIKFFWCHFTIDAYSFSEFKVDDCDLLLNSFPSEIMFSDRIYILFNQLIDIYSIHPKDIYTDYLMTCLLLEFSSQCKEKKKNSKEGLTQLIQEWIRLNCRNDISLEKIAKEFNYNKTYLSKLYKNSIGITPSEQINFFRISEAKNLLKNSNKNLSKIAFSVGFNDEKYFMRVFRNSEKMTPTEYRNSFSAKHLNND